MRLYLDDDTASALLTRLLQNAGHDVETPSGAGLAGRADPIHLTWAIRERRIFLSRNYKDFEELHLLIREAQGLHPGILVVRQDNEPRRDLTPRGIVRALHNLEAAGVKVQNDYLIVNREGCGKSFGSPYATREARLKEVGQEAPFPYRTGLVHDP